MLSHAGKGDDYNIGALRSEFQALRTGLIEISYRHSSTSSSALARR